MTLLESALGFAVDAALGGWLGTMAFFSFVGAPTAFRVLAEDDAGTYVNATFPRYYVVGTALGVAALVTGAALDAVTGGGPGAIAGATPSLVARTSTLLATAVFAYSRWVLVPAMERAGDDAFERYHRRSVLLNALAMGLVAVALAAAQV